MVHNSVAVRVPSFLLEFLSEGVHRFRTTFERAEKHLRVGLPVRCDKISPQSVSSRPFDVFRYFVVSCEWPREAESADRLEVNVTP